MAKITYANGKLNVPDHAEIGFVEGDGTGPDIWRASQKVFDAAVAKAYGGKRAIQWVELFAGDKAFAATKEYLPQKTLDQIRELKVAIKGPLSTPVGKGIRSINVALRQELDLYACIRPVRWYRGVGAPVLKPEKVNMMIFRENTEDVYAGVEYTADSPEGKKLHALLESFGAGKKIRPDCNLGIKPMGPFGSKRLIKKAIQYALDKKLPSVTIMHKGNIMKFTEGAFREWGYEIAKEFGDRVVREEDLGNQPANGRVVIKDRIADNMFQQILLRPEEYSVIAAPNLNGDYISDALAAQVGGLGIAPGGNISDEYAVFEATHGTAPKYAGQDKVNPGSVILSGSMMFEHLGWQEVAQMIDRGLQWAIDQKKVTYDLERQMTGGTIVKCSEFADQIILGMKG